jgi:diguanylate cyclase (GGDEF)-like protein
MARMLLDSTITEELVPSEPRRLRGSRVAGVLFCIGAVLSAIGTLTLDTPAPGWVLALLALVFLTGVICLSISWERISPLWLHAVPAIATVEITACVWGLGADGAAYSWLYLIVVVTVAYAFRSRKAIAAQLGLVLAGLILPMVDPAISSGESLRTLVVSGPTLLIAAVLVTSFRERLEAGKRAYQELSRLDPLTGVGNYRALYEWLEYEIARHQRHSRRFAVMLLDLNGFKQVNETYGHLEGDRLLQGVGRVLARTVRDEDSVARQGGDEFSVLAPETTWSEVVTLAARIRSALATVSVEERVLSTSIGWAIYPENGETMEELLAHADAELRSNKFHSPERQPARLVPAPADARAVSRRGGMAPVGRARAI